MTRKTLFLFVTALAVIAELVALLAGDFEDNIAAKTIPVVYVIGLVLWLYVYVDKKYFAEKRKKREEYREKYRVVSSSPHFHQVYDASNYEQVTAADDGKTDEIK